MKTCHSCQYSASATKTAVLVDGVFEFESVLICAEDEDNLHETVKVCEKYMRCSGCDEVEE